MLLDNIYMPKKCIMHSQRDYSSTVSTGLSTEKGVKNAVFLRFPQGLSTLSTAFPQPLSTAAYAVDMHVDNHLHVCIHVYTYDKCA